MIIGKKVCIARVEFSEGPASKGTKVFLSDGSELEGLLSVSLSAGVNEAQEVTIKAIKGVRINNEQT